MFKIIFFLWRHDHMSREDFIRYYEDTHAPLMIRLVPQGLDFRRNYPIWDASSHSDNLRLDGFDVMTEVTYSDRQFFQSVLSAASDPAKAGIIAADEEAFEQRGRSKLFVVREEAGAAGPWQRAKVGTGNKLLRFEKHLNAGGEMTNAPRSVGRDESLTESISNASCYRTNKAILDDPLTFMGGHHNRDGGVPLWHRFDSFDEFWFEKEGDAYKAREALQTVDEGTGVTVVAVEEYVSILT